LLGAAFLRGRRWAKLVVRQLVSKRPARWPRSPKAVFKAGHWGDDMVGLNKALRPVLIRKVLDSASKRYAELTDYVAGRRLELPSGDELVTPSVDEGEMPR
jgi:hypothetical protein